MSTTAYWPIRPAPQVWFPELKANRTLVTLCYIIIKIKWGIKPRSEKSVAKRVAKDRNYAKPRKLWEWKRYKRQARNPKCKQEPGCLMQGGRWGWSGVLTGTVSWICFFALSHGSQAGLKLANGWWPELWSPISTSPKGCACAVMPVLCVTGDQAWGFVPFM